MDSRDWVQVIMSNKDEKWEEWTQVPTPLLLQAIALLKHDAEWAYRKNATPYADRRHGTGRALSDFTDKKWTEYPSVATSFPESLYE